MTHRCNRPVSDASAGGDIVRIAIDAPVMTAFDYRAPAGVTLRRGQRVLVPFRQGKRVGIVLAMASASPIAASRIRTTLAVLDPEPLLDAALMDMLDWAAAYYQHPPGEAYATALPRLLRIEARGRAAAWSWHLTEAGAAADPDTELRRAPAQRILLDALAAHAQGLRAEDLAALCTHWQAPMRALEHRGWIERRTVDTAPPPPGGAAEHEPDLTPAQQDAVAAIHAAQGFAVFLLDGVTGSGKTEVYLRTIAAQLAAGRQSLVLVPEIGLTPQLVGRFQRRFPTARIALLHSGLTDTQRLDAWQSARQGAASIVIGTRSAVFAPLPRAGLIVVDEEHDSSLKQQEGFRYSARDLAVWRARQLGVPLVLGSATPSLESLANAAAGRYRHLRLPQRTGGAGTPRHHLVDMRHHGGRDGLTTPLIAAIGRHLQAGGQVLLFLNRRGFAPTLLCTGCGQCLECRRCDARMVLHREEWRVTCHHCGATRSVPDGCPDCGGELRAVGQGTERLEAGIAELFPEQALVRIDRDTTRARGEIERRLGEVAAGRARILLGTQMLTKGHHFPGVTLVGIIDADQGLFGSDFRASERFAQTLVQVAGRAGRADQPGEVYIQTLFPEHPLLQLLVREGYAGFAEAALEERRSAGWPPFAHLALLRAESTGRDSSLRFLERARDVAVPLADERLRLLGPAPAPMEKRAGRFRAQLLVETSDRRLLQQFLGSWREQIGRLPESKHARWTLDVDPVELF